MFETHLFLEGALLEQRHEPAVHLVAGLAVPDGLCRRPPTSRNHTKFTADLLQIYNQFPSSTLDFPHLVSGRPAEGGA